MTYDFWADSSDTLQILDLIFNEFDLKIYDLASEFSQEIVEYKSVEEIRSKFGLGKERRGPLTFLLWSQRHGGKPIFRRVSLDPKRCDGHTFRYNTDGWGLIEFYPGNIWKKRLGHSHLGHLNERGALNREEYYLQSMGKVNDWNWKEIQKTSRRLKYQIHNKLSVQKVGSLGILPGADALFQNGIERVW